MYFTLSYCIRISITTNLLSTLLNSCSHKPINCYMEYSFQDGSKITPESLIEELWKQNGRLHHNFFLLLVLCSACESVHGIYLFTDCHGKKFSFRFNLSKKQSSYTLCNISYYNVCVNSPVYI